MSTPEDRISKQMYNLIYRMHQNNTHQSAWLNCIRQILEQNGYGYVWLNQGKNIDHIYVKETLYSCLQDQFVQEWTGIVDAGRKCTLYKHIKTDFKLEPYLLSVTNYQCMVHNVLSEMWSVCIMASIWRKLMGYVVKSQKEKREHCVCKKR